MQATYLYADLKATDSYALHATYQVTIQVTSALPSFQMLYQHHKTFKTELTASQQEHAAGRDIAWDDRRFE